ncbi:MAG: DUF3015 family protein, partial [Pseudomonadota bacterium]
MFIALALFVLAPLASANVIGPAGCGLGNQMMGGEDSQVIAAILNGTSGNQTFGITSGTSNCVDSAGMAKLDAFVEGNRVALETEAARGEGETLESVAQILQCPNAAAVSEALRSSHSEVFQGTIMMTA